MINKIVDLNEYKEKKDINLKENNSNIKATNKYFEAWDKLTSEQKIIMQKLLEN